MFCRKKITLLNGKIINIFDAGNFYKILLKSDIFVLSKGTEHKHTTEMLPKTRGADKRVRYHI